MIKHTRMFLFRNIIQNNEVSLTFSHRRTPAFLCALLSNEKLDEISMNRTGLNHAYAHI